MTADLDTREKLLKAAASVFARRGFDGTTVRDVAEAAAVNVSLVSYYFDGKEGLYNACIEKLGKEKLALAEKVLTTPASVEEFRIRLRLWLQQVLETHVEQRDTCAIIHREHESNLGHAKDVFMRTFMKIFETLIQFFVSAQKNGILRKDCDASLVAEMFYMGVMHLARQDHLRKELFNKTIQDTKYREHVIDEAIATLMKGALGERT